MILLVGLGNPGEKYARHRHNVGFLAVDAIGDSHGFGPTRNKFNAEIRDGYLSGPNGREKTILLKPLTYMNESGQAVGEALRFYKLEPSDVIVFYDELDLAPGKLRVKIGGGAAGHNGIRSIDAHIGNDFHRVRIGIGHPGDKAKVTTHVLGNFSKADQAWLNPMLEAIGKAAPFLAYEDNNRFPTAVAQELGAGNKQTAATPAENASDDRNKADNNSSGQQTLKSSNPFADAFRNLLGAKDQDKK